MNSPGEISRLERGWLESISKEIQTRLESEERRIYEEIKNYPKPIPACDAQFNFLLEERTRIAAEIQRLHETIHAGKKSKDPAGLITDFLLSCPYLDAESTQKIVREFKPQSTQG
jgi:hypothetical protein